MNHRTCNGCGTSLPLTAEFFPVRKDRPCGFRGNCHTCMRFPPPHGGRVVTRSDHARVAQPVKCREGCHDMPWRRPEHGLCVCGEVYAPEPTVALVEFAESRRGNWRELA